MVNDKYVGLIMLIPVHALRSDGKSIICYHSVNDHNHAKNKMRKWMEWWHLDRRLDCNPVDFVLYVGESEYFKFRLAKWNIQNRRM